MLFVLGDNFFCSCNSRLTFFLNIFLRERLLIDNHWKKVCDMVKHTVALFQSLISVRAVNVVKAPGLRKETQVTVFPFVYCFGGGGMCGLYIFRIILFFK